MILWISSVLAKYFQGEHWLAAESDEIAPRQPRYWSRSSWRTLTDYRALENNRDQPRHNVTSWARTLTDCKMITSESIGVSLMSALYHDGETLTVWSKQSAVVAVSMRHLIVAIKISYCLQSHNNPSTSASEMGSHSKSRKHLQAASTNVNKTVNDHTTRLWKEFSPTAEGWLSIGVSSKFILQYHEDIYQL